MKQIKFRGRVPESDKIDGGKIVYGSLVEHRYERNRYWIYPLDGDCNYPVETETVAQLVGYDSNGNEVYEGDVLVDGDGDEVVAKLHSVICWAPHNESADAALPEILKNGPFDFAKACDSITLKEQPHD